MGNGKKPTCDTLKYWYDNEIGHPQSHTERYRSIIKHGKAIKQNQSSNKINQNKLNIHKHSSKTVFLRSRGVKNIKGRVHMGRIKWGRVISRS